MNPLQIGRQVQHLLRAATWANEPGGETTPVFGLVEFVAGDPDQAQFPEGYSWALIGFGNATNDIDEPELLSQTLAIYFVGESQGDPQGSQALTGGPVEALGRSANRGVEEIAPRIIDAVGAIGGADGVEIIVSAFDRAGVIAFGQGKHLALGRINLQATCTARPLFIEPQLIARAGAGLVWDGSQCSVRFDFVRFDLVSKPGPLPSENPGDGTLEYSGAAPSFAGPLPSGTTLTAFARYSTRQNGLLDGASEPLVGSFVRN